MKFTAMIILISLVISTDLLSATDLTDNLESINSKRPILVVSDSINLFSSPKVYAKICGEIYFGTKIFVQQETADFFQVKFFDDLEGTYIDGWIWKKDVVEKEEASLNIKHDYDESTLNDAHGKENILQNCKKKTGFRRISNHVKQNKNILFGNWTREQKNIDVMIADKQTTIANLYKMFKVQDNLLSGQFILKFKMTSDGKTDQVRITEATWSNAKIGNKLNKEIEKKVKNWVFPPDNHIDLSQRRDKTVAVPYVF